VSKRGNTPTRCRSRSWESAATGPATGGRNPPQTQKDDRCPQRVPMCVAAGSLAGASPPTATWRTRCPRGSRQSSTAGWVSQLPGTLAYRSSTRQRLRAVSPTWNAVPAGIHCARRSAGSAGTNNAEPAHRAAPTGTTRKRDFGAAVWCPLRKQILTQKNRLPVFARKVAPRATLYETYVGSKKPMRARCVRAGKGEEIKQGHR